MIFWTEAICKTFSIQNIPLEKKIKIRQEQETIFTNYIPHIEIISTIYKEYLQFNNKKMHSPILKQTKDLNRYLTKKICKWPKKQIKSILHCQSLQKCKLKPQQDIPSHSLEWLKLNLKKDKQ